jgi:prepilin-type N-terminal cleavage/methylation domain-containing protein
MKKTSGFTLIELLIVVALLGALAIGLLATIDPFEQLKKGRDTATRNTATEFYNANLRYYGTKGVFAFASPATTELSGLSAVIATLVSAGELKSSFENAAGTARLSRIVLSSTAADAMTICFDPESKNFALDQNTIFDSTGDSAGADACKGGTAGTAVSTADDCYWCIQ